MRCVAKTSLVFGLAILLAAPAAGQRGGGQGGAAPNRGDRAVRALGRSFAGASTLLTRVDVQNELRVTDEQKDAIRKTSLEIQSKHKADAEALTKLYAEANAKSQAYRKKLADLAAQEMSALLKPEQAKRLRQLELQLIGVKAFAQDDAVKALGLTEEQNNALKPILAEASKPAQFPRGGNLLDRQKKIEAANKEALDKCVAVLTADQKKAWQQLVGEPLTRLQLQLLRNRGGFAGTGAVPGGGSGRFWLDAATPAQLPANPFVQLELKLSDEQIDRIAAIPAEVAAKCKDELAKANADLQKYMARIADYRAVLGKEMDEANAKLLKPEQLTRYKQIDLQRRGPSALAEKEVQQELKLTEQQQADIKTIQDALQKEIAQLPATGGDLTTTFTRSRKLAELTRAASAKMLATLTEAQQKTWKELNGAPFSLGRNRGGFTTTAPANRGPRGQ